MRCPYCRAEFTDKQVRSVRAVANACDAAAEYELPFQPIRVYRCMSCDCEVLVMCADFTLVSTRAE